MVVLVDNEVNDMPQNRPRGCESHSLSILLNNCCDNAISSTITGRIKILVAFLGKIIYLKRA